MNVTITTRPDGTELTNEDVQKDDRVHWTSIVQDGLTIKATFISKIVRTVPDLPTDHGLYYAGAGNYYLLSEAGWKLVVCNNRPHNIYVETAAMMTIHKTTPLRPVLFD